MALGTGLGELRSKGCGKGWSIPSGTRGLDDKHNSKEKHSHDFLKVTRTLSNFAQNVH